METLIGKREKRIDAYDKVTGKGLFASDYGNQFPNLAYMKACRSPYAHAKIKNLDISEANELDGVICILTGDIPGIDWDQFPKTAIIAKDETLPAVLDYYAAIEAKPVTVVDPDYETRPLGFTDRPGDRASNRISPNIVGSFKMHAGDVDAAMEMAEVVVEGEFWTGKKTANPLECANAICRYDSDGGITMWSNGAG